MSSEKVGDCEVVPGDRVAEQHMMVVRKVKVETRKRKRAKAEVRIRLWKENSSQRKFKMSYMKGWTVRKDRRNNTK